MFNSSTSFVVTFIIISEIGYKKNSHKKYIPVGTKRPNLGTKRPDTKRTGYETTCIR